MKDVVVSIMIMDVVQTNKPWPQVQSMKDVLVTLILMDVVLTESLLHSK